METTVTSMSSRTYIQMCVIGFIAMLSSGMLSPILPVFAKTMGAPYWLIGMVVSGFFVSRALCEIPVGMLYDMIGWKLPIVLGMIIQAGATTAIFFTNDAYTLVVARGVQGVGSTLLFLTAVTFIASSSPKGSHGRFVGTFQGVEWIGSISGGIAAGFIAERFGSRTVFLVAALILASGAITSTRLWRVHRQEKNLKQTLEGTRRASKVPTWALLKMAPIYVASTATFFFMFGYHGIISTLLPIYVTFELSFSLVFLGFLAMCISLGQMMAMFVGGPLADKVGYRRVLVVTIAASALSSPLFGQLRTMEQLIALSIIFGVTRGIGLTVPIALIGSEMSPEHLAPAMAIHRTIMDIGGVVGPFVMAAATEAYGYQIGFMIAGAVMVIPLVLLVKARKADTSP